MADSYAPTTELEAVNMMLGLVQLAPVSTLDGSNRADVLTAISTLAEISRMVQAEEWHWNSEEEYPITLDENGYAYIPGNVLRIDTSRSQQYTYDVVKRGDRLYDRYNHTFVFPETLNVDVVWYLAFEDLPEAARSYIAIRAARRFQKKVQADETIEKLTAEDEARARLTVMSDECNTGDYNMFTGSMSTLAIITRDTFLG